MKKGFVFCCIWLAALIAIAWINNAILLSYHPLSYYYTARGMIISGMVAVAEMAIIWPLSIVWWKKYVIPAYKEVRKTES